MTNNDDASAMADILCITESEFLPTRNTAGKLNPTVKKFM